MANVTYSVTNGRNYQYSLSLALKFNEVDWVGIAGVSPDTFDTYVANFVRDFYTGIVRLTERAVAKMDDTKRGKIVNDILR